MNKILSILLLIFFISIFKINAQINEPGLPKGKLDKMSDLVLKRSKRQKTTAWILLGTGAGVSIAGAIIGSNSISNSADQWDIFPRGTLAGGGMILGGITAIITSVPFFIASGRNKRNAHLIFQNDSQSFLHRLYKTNVYSVGINLRL